MSYLDESAWQEIAKWFAGIAAFLATSFVAAVRWWAGDRFKEMSDRLDKHDIKLAEHDEVLNSHKETINIVLVHIDNGQQNAKRIEASVGKLRDDNRDSFRQVHAKLDRLIERQ